MTAAVIAGGVALVVWGQDSSERIAYQRAVSGPPCPPAAAPPADVPVDALLHGTFEGARFTYLRGDMDCQTAPVGDLADDYAPYCAFDRPGYLDLTTGAAHAAYQAVIGQMVVTERDGTWRCAVKPPP